MDPQALQHQIRTIIEGSVSRMGYDLVAVELLGGKGRPVLRLSIDKAGGVSAEDCAIVSDQVSPLLDAADPIRAAYTLEVSSPGIDRPVQRVVDFQRFVGFTVKVRLLDGPARRRYTGEIVSCDGDFLVVSADGEQHSLRLILVDRAQLVLDLEAYQRLGEGLV